MKFYPSLLAIVVYTILFPACKKQTSIQATDPSSSTIHISLTGEEARNLQTLLQKEGVKDSADFFEKVTSVKLAAQGKIDHPLTVQPTDDQPGSDAPGEDEVADAFWVTGQPFFSTANIPQDVIDRTPEDEQYSLRSYQEIYRDQQTFSIRQNTVVVNIPLVATVKYGDPNIWVPAGISKGVGTQLGILPAGSNWGTMTQSTTNNWITSTGDNIAVVHAEAEETRTQIYSTMGTFKISTSVDVSAFKAGAELGAGFTIQNAKNIYNQYAMDGQIMISVQGLYTQAPNITPSGEIRCTDIGILLNN